MATFHSTCVRILRRFIDRIGYDNHFTIYDTDDQKSIMRGICKRLQIDTKQYKERFFLSEISAAKNELISPEKYMELAGVDFREKKIAEVYREYQKELHNCNRPGF